MGKRKMSEHSYPVFRQGAFLKSRLWEILKFGSVRDINNHGGGLKSVFWQKGLFVLDLLLLAGCATVEVGQPVQIKEQRNVFSVIIHLAQPVPGEGGGLFVHDLDNNGRMDILVTSDGHIGAYDLRGKTLWVRKTDIRLFDFYHHPSAIAGDLDGDGKEEIAYLTANDEIVFLDGKTGAEKKVLSGVGKPIAMAIVNLRGLGDRDIVLQYSQTHLKAICAEGGSLLWETHEYRGIEHSSLRQADLDGDGLDEVAGAVIIDHDGTKMNRWDLGGTWKSMDSIVIADIVPGYPLEVALAEQRGANSHTVVVNPDRIIFRTLNPWNWEDPDKLAVGDFDPGRPGLEIFNRSSGGDGTTPRGREEPYRYELAPWVLDAAGNLITKYYLNDHKPDWWTGHGLEEICRIDWYGDGKDYLIGMERHKHGTGAIVDALTGEFKTIFSGKAVRIYAADVLGDYREEVLVLGEEGIIKVFWNNARPGLKSPDRYWTLQHYRRQKQNWNYYSP
ncbi:MAG: FG-GAP-like repeat-containing protein [Candidatus Omnitrophota bacterium]